jgi:hypothetical protein
MLAPPVRDVIFIINPPPPRTLPQRLKDGCSGNGRSGWLDRWQALLRRCIYATEATTRVPASLTPPPKSTRRPPRSAGGPGGWATEAHRWRVGGGAPCPGRRGPAPPFAASTRSRSAARSARAWPRARRQPTARLRPTVTPASGVVAPHAARRVGGAFSSRAALCTAAAAGGGGWV